MFFVFGSIGQTYSYSFKGELTSSEQIEIVEKIEQLSAIQNTKIRYKEDRRAGEFIFEIQTSERAESDVQFSAQDLKSILVSYELEPLNFIELK